MITRKHPALWGVLFGVALWGVSVFHPFLGASTLHQAGSLRQRDDGQWAILQSMAIAGAPADPEEIAALLGVIGEEGVNLLQIQDILKRFGLEATSARVRRQQDISRESLAILLLHHPDQLVIAHRNAQDEVVVLDRSPNGYPMTWTDIQSRLTTNALRVARKEGPSDLWLGSKLRFETLWLDLGGIPPSAPPREAILRYHNTGDQPIAIKKIASNGSCIAVESGPRIAAPGEKGEIRLTFSPKSLAGGVPFRQALQIETDEPGQSPIRAVLAGAVKDFAILSPSRIAIHAAAPGESLEKWIFVTSSSKLAKAWTDSVEATGVSDCAVEWLDPPAYFEQTGQKPLVDSPSNFHDSVKALRIRFTAPQAPGAFQGAITIHNKEKKEEAIVIPVIGLVKSPYKASPHSVTWKLTTKSEPSLDAPPPKKVRISRRDGQPFSIVLPEAGTGPIRVSAEGGGPKESHELTLELAGKAPFLAEKITVKCQTPAGASEEVRISVAVLTIDASLPLASPSQPSPAP